MIESTCNATGFNGTGWYVNARFCDGILYFKLTREVSTAGGAALKLILTASLNTGLKVDVMSMVFFLVVSCAWMDVAKQNTTIANATRTNHFTICCMIITIYYLLYVTPEG